jgi:hypothetical protein
MRTVEQVITEIRRRRVPLSVEGDKIVAIGMLLRGELSYIRKHRAEVIAYLTNHPASESPMPEAIAESIVPEIAPSLESESADFQRGYRMGIEHALDGMKSRTDAQPPNSHERRAAAAPTPDVEIKRFVEWQLQRSPYYHWESECLAALRAALREGDTITPLFAYTCIITRADGSQIEFERVPPRK